MVRTAIVQYVTDDRFEYKVGDMVRVKMRPKDKLKPELASEYIGRIADIRKGFIALMIHGESKYLSVNAIDKIRWVEPDETFENTWEF
jgi:hypothetical protein